MDIGFIKKIISIVTTYEGNSADKSDEELVRLYVTSNDNQAFEEIVSRYANRVYGFALRITKNVSDAEEVFQEVFLILSKTSLTLVD